MERKAGFRGRVSLLLGQAIGGAPAWGHPGLCSAGAGGPQAKHRRRLVSLLGGERLVETPGIFFGCRSLPTVN